MLAKVHFTKTKQLITTTTTSATTPTIYAINILGARNFRICTRNICHKFAWQNVFSSCSSVNGTLTQNDELENLFHTRTRLKNIKVHFSLKSVLLFHIFLKN